MSPAQPRGDAPDSSLRVVIVSEDPSLEEEFRNALSHVPGIRGVLYYAASHRQALELARGRQPNLVLVEIDRDVQQLANFTKELDQLVPGATVAAAFRPDRLELGQSESAVIIQLLRAHVRDFLRRPISTTELRSVLDRLFAQQATPPSLTTGRIASFVSNKGGVGKSTLAVNVGVSLAQRYPDEVLLIDTSLQLGTCALTLDLRPTTSIVDAVRERDRLDETLLRQLTLRHASGLRLLASPADALEASEVNDEAIARILTLARRTFKYVLVDTFPMLDSVVMSILDLSDLAFVVVQGTAPSVAGAARLLPILDGLGFPASRQRIILNYNYKDFFGNLTAADIAERLGRHIDHVLHYERRVLVSMNTGSPHILHSARWQRFGRTIRGIVDVIDGVAVDVPDAFGNRQGVEGHRARLATDRRGAADRRLRDLGRVEGDRRSGFDRRAPHAARAIEREVTL
jgi:pilus assembly protein CpaE